MDGSVVFARWRQCAPSNTFFLPESTTKTASRTVWPFLRSSRQGVIGHVLSPKNSPFWGIFTHLIHGSLSSPVPTTQTASRSVQPFLAGLTTVRDRQTDHATRSVTTGCIYVRSTAMRPNDHYYLERYWFTAK